MKKIFLFFLMLFFVTNIQALPKNNFFKDVTAGSGLRRLSDSINEKIPRWMRGFYRIRTADINGDNRDDIIAHSLVTFPIKGFPYRNVVLLNNGNGSFYDFSKESGLKDIQAAFFLFADFDNDGDQDIFAGLDYPRKGFPNNQILLNNGKGVFKRLENAGVELSKNLNTAAAVAVDFDSDGILDLFVGNGSSMSASTDFIYKGLGDGRFKLIENSFSGMRDQPTNGAVALDYDNDGDQDIFVSTYGVSVLNGHNFLWENEGEMHFKDVGLEKGVAARIEGNAWMKSTGYGYFRQPDVTLAECIGSNGFGPQAGDINNDGDYDLIVATISHPSEKILSRKWSDPSMLLMNRGKKGVYRFEDESRRRKIPFCEGGIGASLADIDNDGLLDIGFTREKKYDVRYTTDEVEQKGWFGLMHQKSDGDFESVGLNSGISDVNGKLIRNIETHVWLDYNRDGAPDLLATATEKGIGRNIYLFKNNIKNNNKWFELKVVGDGEKISKDAIGTRISFIFKDRIISREVQSAYGHYALSDSRILHFGLGKGPESFIIEIKWPNGRIQQFPSSAIRLNSVMMLDYIQGLSDIKS